MIAQVSRMSGYGETSRSKDFEISSVIIREASTDRTVHILVGHTADVTCAAFSPDGRRLATVSFDRTIKLWDVATGYEVFTLRGHTAGVLTLVFSPDGNRIATNGYDATIRTWDAAPPPTDVLQEHEARCQQKRTTLEQVVRADIDDSQRAEMLARNDRWDMAVDSFARAIEREPENLALRYRHLLALLSDGEFGGSRRAAADMLQ